MVYLTPEEVRRPKYQAVDVDRTMSAIMSDAVRAYLSAHPQRGPR
jgi:hypothetical protein